jgi:hypothetical protein
MDGLLDILKTYGTQLSAIGAALTFIFSAYKFQAERRTAHFWKEFEVYHKLVKELVEPPAENIGLYVDRQAAVLYEMRNFKRYYPYSLRMLKGLHDKWANAPGMFPRLINELELTIEHIQKSL